MNNPEKHIEYYGNGTIFSEQWILNGDKERKYKNGTGVSYTRTYRRDGSRDPLVDPLFLPIIKGQLHRYDGPALIIYRRDGSLAYERWSINGDEHRLDGPAEIIYYGKVRASFFGPVVNGGSAILQLDSQNELGSFKEENWWLNGERHREDGPAEIKYSESGEIIFKSYYFSGKKFRFKKDSSWIKRNSLRMIEEVMNA